MKKSLLLLLVILITITSHSQLFKKLRNKAKEAVEYKADTSGIPGVKSTGVGTETNYWNTNSTHIYNNNTGNAGIGTSNPQAKLHVAGNVKVDGTSTIEFGAGVAGKEVSAGKIGYQSFGTNDALDIVGAGTLGSNRKITFWNEGGAEFRGKVKVNGASTIEFGAGIAGKEVSAGKIGYAAFGTNDALDIVGAGTLGSNRKITFWNEGGAQFRGNVGIGTDNPIFKLDVADRIRIRSGSASSTAGLWFNNPGNTATIAFMGVKDVDVTGIYGNVSGWGLLMNTNTGDVAVGNQNPVAGYKLSVQGNEYINGVLVMTGDAKIAGNLFLGGKIGIGGTLGAPLEVYSIVHGTYFESWTYLQNKSFPGNVLSIRAHGGVVAELFAATSDARIKNIMGISNSTKDLETINALQITDYTMKDKIKYGNKFFKKVIAQEVEKVYPQVVSATVGYIPNVYAVPGKIEKTAKGYLLSFTNKHNLSKAAKKIQIMIEGETKQFDIVSIPSENQVLINAADLKTDKVFVYGEEIDDFRNIDYDGLVTLNISATQELSKLVKKQQQQIDLLLKRIEALEKNNSFINTVR